MASCDYNSLFLETRTAVLFIVTGFVKITALKWFSAFTFYNFKVVATFSFRLNMNRLNMNIWKSFFQLLKLIAHCEDQISLNKIVCFQFCNNIWTGLECRCTVASFRIILLPWKKAMRKLIQFKLFGSFSSIFRRKNLREKSLILKFTSCLHLSENPTEICLRLACKLQTNQHRSDENNSAEISFFSGY